MEYCRALNENIFVALAYFEHELQTDEDTKTSNNRSQTTSTSSQSQEMLLYLPKWNQLTINCSSDRKFASPESLLSFLMRNDVLVHQTLHNASFFLLNLNSLVCVSKVTLSIGKYCPKCVDSSHIFQRLKGFVVLEILQF